MGGFEGLEPGAYGLLMVDPPWRFATYSEKGRSRTADVHYDCMAAPDILALPVKELAARDCFLWLWATHPALPMQIETARQWGFEYATSGVWVKRTLNGKLAFGQGYRLRSASEPFIIATRGNPKNARDVRTVIEAPVREHSRKPDEAYEIAEHWAGDVRRADLFARQRRPGWDGWGKELGRFEGLA